MQITRHEKDQKKIWKKNKLKGYVDETGMLFGIDVRGYAVKIGPIHHDAEIIPKLRDWLDNGKTLHD